MNFEFFLSQDNVSFTRIDTFVNQDLSYEAEFYDDKNVSDVKIPFFTEIKLPFTPANKSFLGFDPYSSNASDFPSEDYYYKVIIENVSNTVLNGVAKIKSIEYNSDEPFIDLDLKDFLSVFLSNLKNLKVADILTDSHHTSRHTVSDFFSTTSNNGEAGTIGTQPDVSRIVNFPYLDLNRDGEKYNAAYRQFTEYGSGTERVGLIPSLSVAQYLKQVGSYLNTSQIPVVVKSRLFAINETAAISDFEPEKLQVILPSKLQAKSDINTRKFAIVKPSFQSGRNTSLMSDNNIDGNQKVLKTSYFGSYATFGNYSSTPSTTYQKFGIKRATTAIYGEDVQGETGYFCPHMSFEGKIQWYNGDRFNPSGTIKLNIPTVLEDKMTYKLNNTHSSTSMKFGVFMDVYEDGYPKKRIRMLDSNGLPIELTAQNATAIQGDSEKSNSNPSPSALGPDFQNDYTILFGLLSQTKPVILDPARQLDYTDTLEWSSVDMYLPTDDEINMTFYGDSRYGYSLFVEPVIGQINCDIVTSIAPKNSSGNPPTTAAGVHHFESSTSITYIAQESDLKKLVTEMSGTTLGIECKADRDFNPYFPDDEYVIKDSINNTTEFSPTDLISIICKRFGCGLFYEFDGTDHVIRIDPIHLLRTNYENIDTYIDDLKSIKIYRPIDSIKNLIIKNKDYGLFFDDYDDDKVSIGSTTQEINPEGINDLEISFDSSIYYKSLCGDIFINNSDNVTNGVISEYEAGVTLNVPPLRTDIGVRFSYISAPSAQTRILVPFCITYISRENLSTTTQRIYRKMYSDGSMTEQPSHVFNGFLSHVNSSGFDLLAENELGSTTDYYDLISSTEQVKSKNSLNVEFSMVVPTNSVSSVLFMLKRSSTAYLNNQNVLIKSVSGNVFEENTYLDVKGIIE